MTVNSNHTKYGLINSRKALGDCNLNITVTGNDGGIFDLYSPIFESIYIFVFQNGLARARLLDEHDVFVDRIKLRRALAAAGKNRNPSSLLGATIRLVFTDELASSGGQGLRNDNPEDNNKEPLNPDLCQICKGMSFVFFLSYRNSVWEVLMQPSFCIG